MKHLSHYTLEELKEMFRHVPCDIIEIAYYFYHRDRTYTVKSFAESNHISVSTLYRYLRRLENEQL